MKFEDFSLNKRTFTKEEIDMLRSRTYYMGIGPRQNSPRKLFRFDQHSKTIVLGDKASNCLTGFCVLKKGILVYHDKPLRVFHEPLPISRFDRGRGLIGGSFDHWHVTKEVYNRGGVHFDYVRKPHGHERNIDLSFAFVLDIENWVVDFGYYHNPQGYSGDGWEME